MHLLRILHERQLRTWRLHQRAAYSSPVCTSIKECKQTLELLAEKHLHVRDTISSLNGLKTRYKRLDAAGITRAGDIRSLQRRLSNISGAEHANMLSRVEELRVEHHLKTLISQCHLLRRDLRLSVRQGGQDISPTARTGTSKALPVCHISYSRKRQSICALWLEAGMAVLSGSTLSSLMALQSTRSC